MSTVVSAIGQVTGMKPDDRTIGIGLIDAATAKAQMYLTATLASTSPELRHILLTHLQNAISEHENVTKLAVEKGWVKPNITTDQMVKEAAAHVQPILQ